MILNRTCTRVFIFFHFSGFLSNENVCFCICFVPFSFMIPQFPMIFPFIPSDREMLDVNIIFGEQIAYFFGGSTCHTVTIENNSCIWALFLYILERCEYSVGIIIGRSMCIMVGRDIDCRNNMSIFI